MTLQLSVFEKAGIEVTTPGTVSEVFKNTGLDWEVKQKQIYSTEDCHSFEKIPSFVGNYNSSNNIFLGIVNPKKYKVVQNVEAFNFIDGLTDFTYEKVGTFQNGKKVFVVGKSNEQITLDGSNDPINFYMTFLHGHDGKCGIRFLLSPIRLFCMNQFNLLLETATFKYNIAHTGNVYEKIALVKKAIENSKNYIYNLQNELDILINTKPSITLDQFLDKIVVDNEEDSKLIVSRKEETRNEIKLLYNDKDDLQNYKNTSFGYLSAVSDYISHLDSKRSNADVNNMFIRNLEGNTLINDAYKILKAA